MGIARVQSDDRDVNQLQSLILAKILPLLKNNFSTGIILPNVVLKSGDNTINHKLGRTLMGWFTVRVRTAVTLFDKQDSNATPSKTLVLNASGGSTCDLFVF